MTKVDIGEVHVWTARAPAEITKRASLECVLSETEKTAASRFYFERHRLSYIFSHAALRSILSGYLDRSPGELQFGQNSFGKPHLKGMGLETLNFNMSHSGDVVVVGVTRGRVVGIDVEMIRPMKEFASIARLNFTPQECAFIENSPAGIQQQAFFKSWARKEAVIKAVGKGLSMPLNTFDASILPGEQGRRLTLPADAPEIESWWLKDLSVPDGYVGAVVVERAIAALEYRTWDPSSL
jgi:4'-phosphopantetheinyl transferase